MEELGGRWVYRAVRALEEGSWLKAVQYLRRSIESDPSYLPAYYELADLYFCQGHLSVALRVIDQALHVNPDDSEALLMRAAILLSRRRVDPALKLLRLLKKKNSSPELFFHLAQANYLKGRCWLAHLYLQKALTMDPVYPEAHELLGEVLFQRKDLRGAEKAYLTLLALEPDHYTAHYMLGVIYSRMFRWKSAIREWEAVLSQDPTNRRIRGFLQEARRHEKRRAGRKG